ncbi:hypothetical protein PVAND_014083 [Polypedilum vanderplanki]|uniref:RWD domain-containing protein n=1 Tax=Polypedilum vanderplanki TaxID=319348 RepID=A0A9J6CRP0_POLVA|nr:hypothetical protein PVAND_014083 [Polypedilum vanderplanki]
MSETLEQQKEEIEALVSIYEGDEYFKQLNDTTFQYKYGEEGEGKSFNVEIVWNEEYPNTLPKINLDTYYNRDISSAFKSKIVDILTQEGGTWIGCGMTYTLFECIKEKLTELLQELEEEQKNAKVANITESVSTVQLESSVKSNQTATVKKEQMTKAQKRKMWSRTDNKGNRQRGWNWVDIIKHLSQTGSKDESVSNLSNIQSVTS